MSVYIGVNNIAKKVNNIYIGVNNIAKKVKKGYVGDENNIARKFFSSSSGVDPTKTSFTEAEINALAAYGEINLIPIGSKVTIGNTQDTERTIHTYRVIGKDHQDLNITNWGSTGTVEEGTAPAIGTADLWSTDLVANKAFRFMYPPQGQYNLSTVREWLNGDYYNGFSDVTKTHMKTMVVEYYFTTGTASNYTGNGNNNVTDKVKLLSAKEFNPSNFHSYMAQREGNGYEYFPSVSVYDRNDNARKRFAYENYFGGTNEWSRTCYAYSVQSGNSVYIVNSYGQISDLLGGESRSGVVPCFRLGPT